MPIATVCGISFSAEEPLNVGEALNERWARIVYQLWCGDVRRCMIAGEGVDTNTHELTIPDTEADAAEQEALSIAKELLLAQLSAEGLPTPRNIDEHAKILLAANPALLTRGRERLLARQRVSAQMLSELESHTEPHSAK